MSGDYAVLVDRFSARGGRSWEENHLFLQPIGCKHSDMVKNSEYDDDDDGGIVRSLLIRFAKAAPAVVRDRINSLELPTTSFPLNAQPLALRSQPLGNRDETEQLEKSLETEQRAEELGRSIGKRPREREGNNVKAVDLLPRGRADPLALNVLGQLPRSLAGRERHREAVMRLKEDVPRKHKKRWWR